MARNTRQFRDEHAQAVASLAHSGSVPHPRSWETGRVDRRGRRSLIAALGLLNDRAESPPESILTVIIVQAGLPEPRINHEVTGRIGEFVARTDLMIDEYKIVLEYQGDYHRKTPGQWRADMTRRSKLEALGWKVMEVNADDLRDPEELVRRIRSLASLPRSITR